MSIRYNICESNCPCIHGYTSWYICVWKKTRWNWKRHWKMMCLCM
jgi:hypothetical protein